MDKVILILILISLIGCGGDDDNHTPPQPPPVECNYTYSECREGNVREVLSVSPSGCVGEPILTCEYVPPVVPDCCPTQENTLKCGDCLADKPCLTTNPDIFFYCTGDMTSIPRWHMRLGWGVVFIDIAEPDLSCCPWQKTGICPDECPAPNGCEALYANQPTQWILVYNNGWYVANKLTYESYRVIR